MSRNRDAMKTWGKEPELLGGQEGRRGALWTVWWVTDLLLDVGAFVSSLKYD